MGCSSSSTQASSTKGPKEQPPPEGAQNDEDIRDKYDLGAILGSGSFGQVREAAVRGSPSQEVRAVKMIESDNDDGEWSNHAIFVREVDLLQQICHENIIRYYDFYEDKHFLYVVMELCKGGEVFAKIIELKRFSEKNAAHLGRQMLSAIEYIHKLNICHRDVKAENFMLAEPSIHSVVKMIDFGMACKYERGDVLSELCGSPHYLAPELIGQKYNYLVDVWACGVLLYLLMYGHYPYDAKQPRDIMVKILTEPIKWQTKVKLSKHGLEFLQRTLQHDPKQRASSEAALRHPWMSLASDPSVQDAEVLPTEVIRSAHKKVTAARKQVDPKIDMLRNEKLKQIDEDFLKGVRQGKRLGETPKEEYMSKPEFVRRDTKINTAPSRNLRRGSLRKMLDGASNKVDSSPLNLEAITEASKEEPQAAQKGPAPPARKRGRSASCSAPRRLSYIGTLSCQEERNLASLYEEKRTQSVGAGSRLLRDAEPFKSVMPEDKEVSLPGSPPEESGTIT
mmetsp:Transcript_51620/g.160154  ORF Transcript_51620/g.160154 Transcript_51620/m.160154 type:complete len:508 (+) Transcript_51620:47-1570(+)